MSPSYLPQYTHTHTLPTVPGPCGVCTVLSKQFRDKATRSRVHVAAVVDVKSIMEIDL